ncbi:LacI family DNA-binding transcriptional regulator [Sphingomonas sp. RIT328]|uniref:LacI family DNA-binding transcriptional regulator n=1 Tax=Sphingomonas sp. RIT328 TaxID=1470591 RepID=UPI0004516CC4|nr:LacI family DNA-binding transcriptional regulator [Sphingomonas sp. RIT328]EZP54171.1 Transcriptional regulator, LacI family [Sphingomonas sp. RIT328]
MSRKPARIEEVARIAGVSAATVSRYFNNPSVVAAETANRIRVAVAEVGYLPNLNAGSLASNRSRIIAVLVPDIAQSIFNDTVEAMIEELSMHGNSVMISLTGSGNELLNSQIDVALSRRVDAIILTSVVTDEATRARLRSHPTTIIETWALPDDPIEIAVGFSHHAVGEASAQFSRDRGYRRPHLVVPQSPRAIERAEGFIAAWSRLGGETPTVQPVSSPSHFGQGRLAFRGMSDLPAQPDVALCGSDWIAQGLIVEASAAGIRIPDELAVIGFGNLRLAGDMRPTITSIDIDGHEIARETIRALRRLAEGKSVSARLPVEFRIIARESA